MANASSSSSSTSLSDVAPFDFGFQATSSGVARLLLLLPAMRDLAADASVPNYMPTAAAVELYCVRVLRHLAKRPSVVRYTLSHYECLRGHSIFCAVARIVLGLRIFAAPRSPRAQAHVVFVAPRLATIVYMAKQLRTEADEAGDAVSACFAVHGVTRVALPDRAVVALFAQPSADAAKEIAELALRIDTLVVYTPELMGKMGRACVERALVPRARHQLILTSTRSKTPRVKVRR